MAASSHRSTPFNRHRRAIDLAPHLLYDLADGVATEPLLARFICFLYLQFCHPLRVRNARFRARFQNGVPASQGFRRKANDQQTARKEKVGKSVFPYSTNSTSGNLSMYPARCASLRNRRIALRPVSP